jgi:hypothetical protein
VEHHAVLGHHPAHVGEDVGEAIRVRHRVTQRHAAGGPPVGPHHEREAADRAGLGGEAKAVTAWFRKRAIAAARTLLIVIKGSPS